MEVSEWISLVAILFSLFSLVIVYHQNVKLEKVKSELNLITQKKIGYAEDERKLMTEYIKKLSNWFSLMKSTTVELVELFDMENKINLSKNLKSIKNAREELSSISIQIQILFNDEVFTEIQGRMNISGYSLENNIKSFQDVYNDAIETFKKVELSDYEVGGLYSSKNKSLNNILNSFKEASEKNLSKFKKTQQEIMDYLEKKRSA